MRSPTTTLVFLGILAVSVFCLFAVWPSAPTRYLPGDFWPEGRGISIGDYERKTMRLGLDLQGGAHLVLQAEPTAEDEGDLTAKLEVAKEVIERRVDAFGVVEPEIQIASGNRLDVQVPGMSLPDAERLIGRTATLSYRIFNDAGELVAASGIVDGVEIAMTGEHLESNTYPERRGTTFAVNFETTGVGNELMRQITTRALQHPIGDPRRRLLVYLDTELISDAVVQGVIEDQGTITGLDSFTEANDLSRQLNAGALPVPLRTIQANEVSASLGDDSVKASVNAAEIGLLAVLAFMILYYRLPGVLAAFALIVYALITLTVFKMWPVTLTLSGIAAFILSVGMAVDANILIFERMKEELRRGRPLATAIETGFRRAWPSIRDSNVATFITCAILFWFGDQFGASFVRGFAITLAIGVAVSMFSAIVVTRTFLRLFVGTRIARSRWLFNAEPLSSQPEADDGEEGVTQAPTAAPRPTFIAFAQRRWVTLGLSLIVFIAAAVTLLVPPPLKAGIEFTGGSTFTLQFAQEQPAAEAAETDGEGASAGEEAEPPAPEPVRVVEPEELRDALARLGHEEARVQGAGFNTYLVRTIELQGAPPLEAGEGPVPPGEIDDILAALEEEFGPVQRLDFATVSGTVSTEIARDATLAVVAAAVAILIYVAFAFRRQRAAWRYGLCAVIALVHDSVIVLGLFSLLAKVAGTEVDTAFIVAILTVIGFSVHDTIVVFDRVREVTSRDTLVPFSEAVNVSLTETLVRSINTSFVTVLTIIAMFLIGGVTIQNFLLVLLVGVIAGTYSSIFVAAQVLVAWDNHDIGRFFRRLTSRGAGEPQEAAATGG
ncbi:MAG: protein translocase subunit SecD [Dehalococcoidia bacterium]|nr:protein translocase subunit SecD [Dehalococcoidia bacterium]MYD27530.1 protein translocase subunit SecD [Dehalococcoidia bacterium]